MLRTRPNLIGQAGSAAVEFADRLGAGGISVTHCGEQAPELYLPRNQLSSVTVKLTAEDKEVLARAWPNLQLNGEDRDRLSLHISGDQEKETMAADFALRLVVALNAINGVKPDARQAVLQVASKINMCLPSKDRITIEGLQR